MKELKESIYKRLPDKAIYVYMATSTRTDSIDRLETM